MSISKKLRFEVFKRDNFICGYCGKTPPAVVLEVDHINPKSEGGADEINNLITACFDCNRGKKNIPLERIAPGISQNLEVLKEKELQLKEYNEWISKIDKRMESDCDKLVHVYASYFDGWIFTETFRRSLKRFLGQLPYHAVEDALHLACSRMNDKDKSIRYFCGVCWNMIKSGNHSINGGPKNV